MIMRHIDRTRSTGGGMAASFAVHAGMILLLLAVVGRQAVELGARDELTEIAYIEAKYGEDVASKVTMKEPPRNRPEPPGRGVNTDSAFKPKAEASPEPPRPEPRSVSAPEPQLKQAQAKPTLRASSLVATAAKQPKLNTEVAAPVVAPKQTQKVLAAADQLTAKAPRPQKRQVIDAGKLAAAQQDLSTFEVAAPQAAQRHDTEAFAPRSAGLTAKTGTVALGDDALVDTGTRSGGARAVAEAGEVVASGGGLQSNSRGSYAPPAASLSPTSRSGGGSGSGGGVMDVTGPSGGGGGAKSGRKTILNYGSGGGGRGGSLNSRARIAEPAAQTEIVAAPRHEAQSKQDVAEVALDGKGVNMTISGQIKGRKILQSSAPVYSAEARRHDWEGVVAVHFTVLANGQVKDNMYFEQTSVHRDLNKAAMAAIKSFRFAPLSSDQAAVEQWGVITIVFKLN